MASLQYAKESIVLKVLQDVADNDKRTQTLELSAEAREAAKRTLQAPVAKAKTADSFDARLRPLSPDRFGALAACTVDALTARARAGAPLPLVVRDVFLLAPCDLGPLVAAGLALHPAGRVYLQVACCVREAVGVRY